ncbi:hypothetical protein H2200_012380 [Cladophialophora chaetospira]|uniref:Nucleolar 27S pre-rRNA processing Urb2/Npa2 C-terminal domain-containing protein n=1 Tax=Cladophialophora chaetospira TaxID=386627 RepID=A0AA38WXQ9_9EURO|nr:hypothetical protein H2200_012380 [Cladophialophora chaetospira]
MAHMSFEARMADLERLQGPPDAVLDEAAKIIGIDLEKTIHLSFARPLYKTNLGLHGYKEQWILRWLLKKLGVSDSKSKGVNGKSQQSFINTTKFWSLLLNLTCSIPNDACLDILVERHFYSALAHFIRQLLHGEGAPRTSGASAVTEHDGPPTKKRRLFPPASWQENNEVERDLLLWTALQAACRCVDLFDSSSSVARTPCRYASAWTGTLKTQAELLGSLLEPTLSLLTYSHEVEERDLIAAMLNMLLAFWNEDVSPATNDERQLAFASHCVTPCLSLLGLLAATPSPQKSLITSKNALERLLCVQVVFPLRTIFNEQFTKKWRSTSDVVLYEQMETLLQAYSRLIQPEEGDYIHSHVVTKSSLQKLCWILLDVAARSIPLSDVRRRQQEQQFLDSLLIWLVHVTWPQIPHITSTGVLRQQFAEGQDNWVSPLEDLLDVAHSRKIHFSQPTVSYILQAVLATNSQSASWTLLAKVIQLDLDILIPASDSSASKAFLDQLIARIESTTVSQPEYDLLRDDLILPLMRKYSQSRALGAFLDAWRQGLVEAIRTRYISKHGTHDIPAVLVWDDDDIFEELKTLSVLHAPPGMSEKMLKDLVTSITGLGQKIGSTAEEFAEMAIFTALLQAPFPDSSKIRLDHDQLILLFHGMTEAMRRKTDYQGQRWRLIRLARLLIERMVSEDVPAVFDSMLEANVFVSLKDLQELKETDAAKQNAKCLEALEHFHLVIDLAAKSRRFESNIRAEMSLFVPLIRDVKQGAKLWNGRSFECRNSDDLIGPCIGKLLQRTDTFMMYPDIFEEFVSLCTLNALQMNHDKAVSAPLGQLCQIVLSIENVAQSAKLRNLLLEKFDTILIAGQNGAKDCRSLLENVPLKALGKSSIRKLASAIHQRLFQETYNQDMESIAADLDSLLYLDSLFPGTFIDGKHWQDWVKLSQRELECTSGEASFDQLIKRTTFPAAYLKALQSLERIFQVNWARALKASRNDPSLLNDICSDMMDSSLKLELLEDDNTPFSCLQNFLAVAWKTVSNPNQIQMLESIRQILKVKLSGNLKHALDDKPGLPNLLKLKLILQAALSVYGAGLEDELSVVISSIHEKLQSSDCLPGADSSDHDKRLWLSVQRLCLPWVLEGQKIALETKPDSRLQQLISAYPLPSNYSIDDIARLATESDLFVRQLEPKDWASILSKLRENGMQWNQQPACVIIQASILSYVEQRHSVLDLTLTQQLGRIALLENASHMSATGLLLALGNCKTVLEVNPLMVNQSLLDGVLAALHAATSTESGRLQSLEVVGTQASLNASSIYEGVCAIMGAIFSRHRRRLSDRHHLLLPVLQNLLRCLFWPGLQAVNSQKGVAAHAISNFGKTLPRWIYDSALSLPLSSVDHLSRLLSSICNPTVSAARSSSKRRNELNDEVKKTRKVAGQHMQYLVTEYCRCFLDGQILPAMKDQLMPGMYKVMDAIDRDIMRAMNAGMDPSSRAIFKNLYDDYVKYGRWDKS